MFLKYHLTVLWLAPLDSPNGQGASRHQKWQKVIRKQHEPRRSSFERLKLELLELEVLGLQLRESGSRAWGPWVLGPRASRVLWS